MRGVEMHLRNKTHTGVGNPVYFTIIGFHELVFGKSINFWNRRKLHFRRRIGMGNGKGTRIETLLKYWAKKLT